MANRYAKPNVGPAWGETAVNPADIITMQPSDVSTGWPLSGTPPSRQRFNYIINWATSAIRYFMQRGLSDYDAAETYSKNSLIIGDDGNTYKSSVDNNIGNLPSTHPASWAPWGLTLAQVNASQLTQANLGQGDNSTKVANANFVTTGLAQLSATITAAYNAAIAAASAALNASINAVQTNLNNAVAALNASIANAINTAEDAAIAAITPGYSATFAANGHIRFPTWAGGFQINWGTVPMPGGSSSDNPTNFNFELSFQNNCFACIPATYGNTDRISFIHSFNKNGGVVSNNGSNVQIVYIAVGN